MNELLGRLCPGQGRSYKVIYTTQRGAGSSRGTKSTQILESTMGQRRKYELAGVAVRMRVAPLVSGSTAQHTL